LVTNILRGLHLKSRVFYGNIRLSLELEPGVDADLPEPVKVGLRELGINSIRATYDGSDESG
jgi:hypothetical protein